MIQRPPVQKSSTPTFGVVRACASAYARNIYNLIDDAEDDFDFWIPESLTYSALWFDGAAHLVSALSFIADGSVDVEFSEFSDPDDLFLHMIRNISLPEIFGYREDVQNKVSHLLEDDLVAIYALVADDIRMGNLDELMPNDRDRYAYRTYVETFVENNFAPDIAKDTFGEEGLETLWENLMERRCDGNLTESQAMLVHELGDYLVLSDELQWFGEQ